MDLSALVLRLVEDVAALREGRRADRARIRALRERVNAMQDTLNTLTNAPSQEPEFSSEVMRAYREATRDLPPHTKRIVLGKLRTLKADGMDDRHLMASLAAGEELPPIADL